MAIINNGFVAMFDILGFASLIKEENLDDILGYITNGFSYVVESNAWGSKQSGKCYNADGEVIGSLSEHDKDNLSVSYRYYFDTLIYFTEDTSEISFYKMMVISAKILAQMYFFVGLPIRGGISCGELYVDDKNIFGKSLIDAHECEGKQQWAGVMISDIFIEKYKGTEIFKDMERDGLLLRYDIPLKNNTIKSGYTLNWMQYNGGKWDMKKFENQWQSLRKDKEIKSDDVKEKLENTIKFRKDTLDINIANFRKYNFGTNIGI